MSSNANKAACAANQYQFKENPTALHGQQNGESSDHSGYLTTDAMADAMGLKAQSIRKRLSQTGSYFGLRPVKLPNRRLIWKADAVSKFMCGEGV